MNENQKIITTKFQALELPLIRDIKSKEWILFGEYNLFPQKMIQLYQESAIHHTAVDVITQNIYGKGIDIIGDTIQNLNQESLNEIYEKISLDYTLFTGYALNVIWSKDGSKIAEIYHLPFNNVRSGKLNEDDKVDTYFYSSDWVDTRKYKPKEYKCFDPLDNRGDNASQIFYFYNYTVGNDYYPLPSYMGAVNDIELDSRIAKFHNANISNGLAPSMFIKFRNGIPTPEARAEIYREIEETFTGETNAGRFFLSFSDPGNEMEVEPIQNTNDQYYITLDERITSRILTAHRITSPLLLGVKVSGDGFSSNADEIQVAYSHFEGTVIAPKRKKILNSLKYLLKFKGYNVDLSVEPNNIEIKITTND
jgi:hypothetical protein